MQKADKYSRRPGLIKMYLSNECSIADSFVTRFAEMESVIRRNGWLLSPKT